MVSLADELVASDRPFAALVTLSLSKLKNLCCLVLLNNSMALSAAGRGSSSGVILCMVPRGGGYRQQMALHGTCWWGGQQCKATTTCFGPATAAAATNWYDAQHNCVLSLPDHSAQQLTQAVSAKPSSAVFALHCMHSCPAMDSAESEPAMLLCDLPGVRHGCPDTLQAHQAAGPCSTLCLQGTTHGSQHSGALCGRLNKQLLRKEHTLVTCRGHLQGSQVQHHCQLGHAGRTAALCT